MTYAHLVVATTLGSLLLSCSEPTGMFAQLRSIAQSDGDTLIHDTVVTDEGLFLVKHRSSWFSEVDSIQVYEKGALLRAVRLNDGGYVGSHTRLAWSNDRFMCFDFACGSPCWGSMVVDLRSSAPVLQRLFTVHRDSIRNTICYWDTSANNLSKAQYRLESLVTGRTILVELALEGPTASTAGVVDSTWTSQDSLFIRRRGGLVVSVDMRRVQ